MNIIQALKHITKHPGYIIKIPSKIINNIWNLLEKEVLKWALKSPRGASYYYCLFSKRFDREHYSVLIGKTLHINKDINSISNNASLRRSLHMIEKGIESIPRKAVWAEGYILDVIETLKNELKYNSDKATHQWAYEVLDKYFAIIKHTDITKEAENKYINIKKQYPLLSCEVKHVKKYIKREPVINYDNFIHLCNQRHSIRWYEDKEVPVELVMKAIEAGLKAPSACNRQPFRYIIVKDEKKLNKVVNMPMGCKTFAHNIKLMVVLIGDLSAYFDERDRHLIYIDGGLTAMNFMLALETLGLSSCPINWPDIEEKEQKMEKEFNLKKSEKGILLFSVGYPLNKDEIPSAIKKDVEQVTNIY